MKNLSIVIPVYNEQDNVQKLADEVDEAFKDALFDWEVIWVDDCSDDNTPRILQDIASKNYRHHVAVLPHRSGQSASVLNGIQLSSHYLIGTLDGDGQNSPYDLLNLKMLLEKEDLYLAQGVRLERHDAKIRLFSTGIANSMRRLVLGDNLVDVGCAVRVFKKEIVFGLPSFKGWHRFFPVMISFLYPDKILEYPVSHRERLTGISKYGVFNRLWVGLYDLVGILWLKKRMARIFLAGEIQWKNSHMLSASSAKSFSPEEFLFNGSPVSEQMNQ